MRDLAALRLRDRLHRAVDLQGLDNAPIYDVTIRNATFGEVRNKSVVKNVRGLKLENVTIAGKRVESL